jgi:Ca2+-binding EF-hand superfamily protein
MLKYARRLSLAILLALAPVAALAQTGLEPFDTDHSGTMDIEEAETRGREVFRALDANKDGSLSGAELAGRLDDTAFADYDSNSSKSLDRSEYAKAIGIEFRNADGDGNSRLDADELKSEPGAKLLRLIR